MVQLHLLSSLVCLLLSSATQGADTVDSIVRRDPGDGYGNKWDNPWDDHQWDDQWDHHGDDHGDGHDNGHGSKQCQDPLIRKEWYIHYLSVSPTAINKNKGGLSLHSKSAITSMPLNVCKSCPQNSPIYSPAPNLASMTTKASTSSRRTSYTTSAISTHGIATWFTTTRKSYETAADTKELSRTGTGRWILGLPTLSSEARCLIPRPDLVVMDRMWKIPTQILLHPYQGGREVDVFPMVRLR